MVKKTGAYRRGDLLQLFLSLAILAVVAVASSFTFFKIDLTEEKRHTLTDATVNMLEGLDDVVFVRCYLHGDFPARFKRLEKAVRERLDEFDDYSGGGVEYEFIDVYASGDKQTINEIQEAIYDEGLRFTRIAYEENGVRKFQNIWPGAVVTYKGKSVAVQLFKSNNPEPTDEMVNTSINNIEFEFASKLRMLLWEARPKIAILDGHGELPPVEMADLEMTLREDYDIERVEIEGKVDALCEKLEGVRDRTVKYDLVIVAKPDSAFGRADKILLDQYIMNGGRVLWMVDPILTDLDSLRENQQTLANTNEMELYDMLFDYGVRLNRNLIIDYQCAPILLDGGPMGNQRNMQLQNWYFAPLVIPGEDVHPICANLDPIHFDFTSSLDTVGGDPGVTKTVLLQSSPLSLERKAPVRVTPGIVQLDIEYFRNSQPKSYPLAVLLEGEFISNFKGRLADTLMKSPAFAYREVSKPTRQIVISDGDIARNSVRQTEEGWMPMPLGYDRYAQRVVYDNKEFLLNAVNYLLDDSELISIRSRSIELRKLDAATIKENRSLIQLLNVVLPLVLIGILGVLLMYLRKRKYA
jgi:gliding-associated putative ABC transporter substrate-binding component GldG